ncbi:MAG: HDOD domain-containing protein [Spirochaetota bacterium]|nr:HDOD domain-containing protein [Spirochaetota bacterium]
MGEIKNSILTINPPDYKKSIMKGENFYIKFSLFTPDAEALLIRILHRYLEKHDILYMKDVLITVLREVITNGVKANTKRMYFSKKKLDITKKDDYRSGMETFKKEVYEEKSEILEEMKMSNLYVQVLFKNSPEKLRIEIINNTPIIEEELTKIEARIKKGYLYNDVSESFGDVLDDSEGAGLGLIIAVMLLKNAGFSPESFNITTDKRRTVAQLIIPQKLNRSEFNSKIADEILKEVEKIPSLPENILEIQRLCSNPKSTIKEISESIKRDPGLTTSILKLANSAGYIVLNKVETIEQAVKIIGLKGINTLLIASGVQKIMDSRYSRFKAIWDNSYRAAFYAQKIAMHVKKTGLSQFAYLSALLSDIGKIVLLAIEPEKTNKIKEIAGIKKFEDSTLIEEITIGISHSTLGSLICKKWKFNEAFVKTIEFHNRPHIAYEKYRELIYIVYLAKVFTEIEDNKYRFEVIEKDVLEYFNINNSEDFKMLHGILLNSYNEQYTV